MSPFFLGFSSECPTQYIAGITIFPQKCTLPQKVEILQEKMSTASCELVSKTFLNVLFETKFKEMNC